MYDHTYDLTVSNSQVEELEKLAFTPATTAGWGRLIGTGIGAAGGALAGAARAEPGDKGKGAIRGALYGGAAGLAGGQLATRMGQKQVENFGRRQLHSTTGYLPGRGLFGTKGGPISQEDRIKKLKDIGMDVPGTSDVKKLRAKAEKDLAGGYTGRLPEGFRKFWAGRRAESRAAQRRLVEEGMTSIPGVVRGYMGKTPGKLSPWEATKLNIKAPGMVMGGALPAAFMIPSVQGYRETGDIKQLGEDVGSNIGFMAGGAVPILGSTALGAAGGAGGRLVGKGIESVVGKKTPSGPPPRRYVGPGDVAIAQRAVGAMRSPGMLEPR